MLLKYISKATIYITFITGASPSIAAPNVPAGIIEQIDPGRTVEELSSPQSDQTVNQSVIIQNGINEVEALPNKRNEQIKFTLRKINITGNTAYDDQQLEQIYKNQLNTTISLNDLINISLALTKKYRDAGYLLTKVIIPPQSIEATGTVSLQIIEGYVAKIFITGKVNNSSRNLLLKYGKRISDCKPINISVLERYSLFANDIPGADVKVLLVASDAPGATDLYFVIEEKNSGWNLGANNFNSQLMGRNLITIGAYVNGLTSGSQTGIRGAVAGDPNLLKFSQIEHSQQLNDNGLGIKASLSSTRTKPEYANLNLPSFDTPGNALLVRANLHYALVRSRKQNFMITANASLLNSNTTFSGVQLFNDKIRTVGLQIDYDFFDAFINANTLMLSIDQGINVLGASASPPSVINGKTVFTKLNLNLSRYQNIFSAKWYLFFAIKSQYSFSQLLSAEKFGFGGGPFGYGYSPSVIVGDDGVAGRAEIQYNIGTKLKYIPTVQLFLCADGATVWNINTNDLPPKQSASSGGGGVRATIYRKIAAELILAKPFNRYITNDYIHNIQFLFNIMYLS